MRGCNLWFRIKGEYPPLTILKKEDRIFAEWRSTGGLTVIAGIHPSGKHYISNNKSPLKINFNELKKICKNHNIGTVKLEIARDNLPNINFLKKVRQFCSKKKIILIFDECTSGFRRNLGGIHLTTGINPDIAILGKAMGNGYAITAVIGKTKIMKAADQSFISSTFWTERIGFVAANKTIEYMKKNKTYKILIKNGRYVVKKWAETAKKNNIKIRISGIESIASFSFEKNNLLYKTFLTQEMIKNGYLASNLIYLSTGHTKKVIDRYIYFLNKIFKKISIHQKSKKKQKILKGPICHSTFKRLTD